MKTDTRRRMLWGCAVGGGVLIALSVLVRERGAYWLGVLSGVVLVAVLWFATGAFRRDSSS